MDPSRHRIHEITSLGRPIDPGYPTNRALLLLLPVAAGAAAGLAVAHGLPPTRVAWQAGGGALAAFGSWALARELAPDDETVGAFLAMALGYTAFIVIDPALVPVFAALFYARLVGRSTGLPATGLDSVLVTLVALLAAWRAGSPWPAVAGAAAFMLDAVLRPRLARQWLFAGLCAAGAVALASAGLAPRTIPVQPELLPRTLATMIAVGTIALIATTREYAARSDATGEPLSVPRVRGAQTVTLLTALGVAASGSAGIESGALIWATLAGVTIPAGWRGLVPRATPAP